MKGKAVHDRTVPPGPTRAARRLVVRPVRGPHPGKIPAVTMEVAMNACTRTLLAVAAAALLCPAGAIAQGALENPQPGGTESGIAAITGWHCTAKTIEVRIDGASVGPAGAGTSRADTAAVCGRTDTGFSLLYNYALLKGGTHRVDVYADGVAFGSATFNAGGLGTEFLTGAAASHRVTDFPVRGTGTRLTWSQPRQGFVVTGTEPLTGGALVGSYAIRNLWLLMSSGEYASTLAPGVTVSGTYTYRSDGTFTATITLIAGGQTSTESFAGTYVDGGHYILQDGEFDLVVERGETLTLFTMAGFDGSVAGLVLSASRIQSAPGADAPGDAATASGPAAPALRTIGALLARAMR